MIKNKNIVLALALAQFLFDSHAMDLAPQNPQILVQPKNHERQITENSPIRFMVMNQTPEECHIVLKLYKYNKKKTPIEIFQTKMKIVPGKSINCFRETDYLDFLNELNKNSKLTIFGTKPPIMNLSIWLSFEFAETKKADIYQRNDPKLYYRDVHIVNYHQNKIIPYDVLLSRMKYLLVSDDNSSLSILLPEIHREIALILFYLEGK